MAEIVKQKVKVSKTVEVEEEVELFKLTEEERVILTSALDKAYRWLVLGREPGLTFSPAHLYDTLRTGIPFEVRNRVELAARPAERE